MSCQKAEPACNGQGQSPAPGEDVLGAQVDAPCHQNACTTVASQIRHVLTNSPQPLEPTPLVV